MEVDLVSTNIVKLKRDEEIRMTLYNTQFGSTQADKAFNAASKPVADAASIFAGYGSKDLGSLEHIKRILGGHFVTKFALRTFFSTISAEDTVIIQYPIYLPFRVNLKILEYLTEQHSKIILFVHDVDSLRKAEGEKFKGVGNANSLEQSLKNEVRLLNYASTVILPTEAMEQELTKSGLNVDVKRLNMYDYLLPSSAPYVQDTDAFNNIIFAGNLNKSSFIQELHNSNSVKYQIFGLKPATYTLPKDVNYEGAFPPDQLSAHFKTGFGLVWDGESSQEITGVYGKYLRYNCPYKTSNFLAAGIPVVVWDESGIADFVVQKQVGIVVKSLPQMEAIVSKMTRKEFNVLLKNARTFGKQLRDGEMTKSVMNQLGIVNANTEKNSFV